jgi:23S rRNA (adenine2503-C2)-methyltransferase
VVPVSARGDRLRAGARQPTRRFFVEYVLLGGVNDAPDDARRLAQLLHGIDAQVNVIPHNPFPGSPYVAPARAATLRFQQQVKAQGVKSIVRWPRGADVAGACGQLALRHVGQAGTDRLDG